MWRVKIFLDSDLSTQLTESSRPARARIGNQAGYGLASLGDNDFFPSGGHVDKAGKLGLGLVDIHFIHD